jgi:hypothetical protein
MTISGLRKGTLSALMLVFMAFGALTACASTGDGGSDDCAQDDLDCKEESLQDLPV